MKKVRIIDVATHASVSKSTVSQYLNGRFGHMSAGTKQKIKSSIEELNYVPNPIARSLKVEKTKTIGVVVRDIAGYNTSRVLRGIDDFCKSNGYNVLIYNSDFDGEAEKRALLSLKQMCVDAIIITSSGLNSELINQFIGGGMPVVQFQLEHPDCQSHIVLSDYREAAFNATEHLLLLGHKRICFMTQEFESSLSRNARFQGYSNALAKHGIEPDNELIQFWDRETGFRHSPVSLIQGPDAPSAIFTQHLAITADLLQSLNSAGIHIPQQVSIIGFDEIPMVELFKVPITVIKQDAYLIGKETAKLAVESSEGKHKEFQRTVVACSIVERDSCRAV
ncbi:LacI family DNA-binding transcriptional regulator [Vibrio sp. 10N.261.51.F12]|uniref:LacI family DNA-binding transcriptional regulator n=1 Tax=Vibrio sp. 10N.261.51.F12 TaxID=3229679 RepID=UPI00354EA25B